MVNAAEEMRVMDIKIVKSAPVWQMQLKRWEEKWMEQAIVNIFILLGAIKDYKTRSIPFWYLYLGSVMAVIIGIYNMVKQEEWEQGLWLYLFPGILFLTYRFIRKKGLGYGDGALLCILGICLGKEIWQIWYISILLLCGISIILLTMGKINTRSKIAYYPFLWAAHSMVWIMKYI